MRKRTFHPYLSCELTFQFPNHHLTLDQNHLTPQCLNQTPNLNFMNQEDFNLTRQLFLFRKKDGN